MGTREALNLALTFAPGRVGILQLEGLAHGVDAEADRERTVAGGGQKYLMELIIGRAACKREPREPSGNLQSLPVLSP